ncbi:hypothetical protein ACSQ67_001209 [Phaseolus vulgaris]
MKVKYAELVTLNNMIVFAVNDLSIFSGSHVYISNVRLWSSKMERSGSWSRMEVGKNASIEDSRNYSDE